MAIPSILSNPAFSSPSTTSDEINENALKVLGLRSLFEKICSNLNPKDMSNLLQTCKIIKNTHDHLKESNPNHYHLLFAKVFGYIDEDKTCSNIEKVLKKASRSNNLTLIHALMKLNKFKEIKPNSLGWALEKASKKGYLNIVQALIASEKFKEISLPCLNRVLRTSHLPIIEVLTPQYYLLKKASTVNMHSLGWSLKRHSGNGELNMIQALIRFHGFQEVSSDDLGWALENAVSNNHLPIVEAFIESGRFQEIDSYYLGWSLREASEKGHLPIVQALIASNDEFQKISPDDLGWALENASRHSCIYILEDIGFQNDDLKSSFPFLAERGSKEGYPLVVKALIESTRFHEIDSHYLSLALIEAAENGELGIVETLITSNKFQEVSSDNLSKASNKALEKGYTSIVEALNNLHIGV